MIAHERTKMFVINKETYKNNDIEVLVKNNGTLWLNEKHVEEKLYHKNLVVIKRKYCLDYTWTIESIDLN